MIVANPITAWRGTPRYLDLAALEAARTEGQWDTQFDALWERLGITPKADGPRWILASYWA